ncbi:MAG TPA: hypothetical protein VKT28_04635 [Puia sp.]|nr:hypothetical protein [Puia sp.]
MRINLHLLRVIFGITSIPLFCMLTGCAHYYKIGQDTKETVIPAMNTPKYEHRYFILRNGGNAYYMNNILLSDDKKTITCKIDTLSDAHLLHLRNGRGGHERYKASKSEAAVLNEVHLYIATDTSVRLGNNYSFGIDKIEKIEVIEKNKGKTTASYVLGGVAITASIFAIVVVIIAATKSSCPFVSAYDGTSMKLQGEIYGGAIYPQLCRNDYLKLNMAPTESGKLQLQISNELKEKQFTDVAELMVITHKKDVTIAADENGNLHSISNPILPSSATVAGKDVMTLIKNQNDNLSFNFDDTSNSGENNNTLHLSFENPLKKKSAKLVLRLKNSYWLDMVYGKFTQGFGKYYSKFIQKQSSTPIEKLQQWKKEQHLPLQISLQTEQGWQEQQNLTLVGPVATREMAIPIDLGNMKDDKINLQLNAGFMFWEIDYAAIDFSDDADIHVSKLLPLNAIDEKGNDVTQLLSKEDGNYLEQPEIGDATVINYDYTPVKDSSKTQTFILHAKGYYEHVREYTNAANISFLKQFRQPGAMSDFSMRLYKQAMNADVNALVKK